MTPEPRVLLVGTADTKADEILYLADCLRTVGARAAVMDVGVLGTPRFAPDIPNRAVAAAAGTTLEDLIAQGDENVAMTAMAAGAARLTADWHAGGRIDGVIALGGTMGTDLALDVASALPLGVPKLVLSTVSFSHLIPPERIAPDLTMMLWAGGLYGLNPVCRSILAQAAGAVAGACRALPRVAPGTAARPLIGMTSLGKSCLAYMVGLKPALEARGYEVAVFHCTGMGGQAFEALAAQGRFAAVFDLCLQELSNAVHGSVVQAGAHRLTSAGARGIPQIVAPGATDMIDLPTWQPLPAAFRDRPYHAHNRLIASVTATPDERRATARTIGERLARASGPVAMLLPQSGIEEWDRPGAPMHDPAGLAATLEALRDALPARVERIELDAHINDPAFCDAALAVFDRWVAQGKVAPGLKDAA